MTGRREHAGVNSSEEQAVTGARSAVLSTWFLLLFALTVIVLAAILRFWGLSYQDDADVDARWMYYLNTERLPNHDLSFYGRDVLMVYLGGRFTYQWLLYWLGLLWGHTPLLLLRAAATFGVLAVAVLLWNGERHFRRNTGLFAGLILAVALLPLFYSRSMRDYAHVFFFLSLGASLVSAAWNSTRRRGLFFFLAGFFLGFGPASNYITLPAIAAILGVVGLACVYDLCRGRLCLKEAVKLHAAFGLGFMVMPLAFESFYPICAYYFPFWDLPHGWSHFQSLFGDQYKHEQANARSKGFEFYWGIFWNQAWWVIYPAILGLALNVFRPSRWSRHVWMYAAVLLFPCILMGANKELASYLRNAWPSYLGFVMLAAIGWSEIVVFLTYVSGRLLPKVSGRSANAIVVLIMGVVIGAFALRDAPTVMFNRSAAEMIHRYIQVDRACVTKPLLWCFHWQKYYFPDRTLDVQTWDDVRDRFLWRRCEYWVNLNYAYGGSPNAPKELANYKGNPAIVGWDLYRELTWTKVDAYDLHDPAILEEKLGLMPVMGFDGPQDFIPAAWGGKDLPAALGDEATRTDLRLTRDGILEIRGRVDLATPGEMLAMAVGTPTEPVKYYLELFPGRLPNPTLNNTHGITSIQTCLLVRGVRDVRVSFLYMPSRYANPTTPPPQIHDVRLTQYADDFEPSNEQFRIGPSTNRTQPYMETLKRFEFDYPAQIVANGTFETIDPKDSTMPLAWSRCDKSKKEVVYRSDPAGKDAATTRPEEYAGYMRFCGPSDSEAVVIVQQPSTRNQGLYQTIKPGSYRPNGLYRVRFRAKTNRNTKGEVDVTTDLNRYRSITSPTPWWNLPARIFWRGRWRDYEFSFMAPPRGDIPLYVLIKQCGPTDPYGSIQVSGIAVEEMDSPERDTLAVGN